MPTKLTVFLLLMSIVYVQSLPPYMTDVEENQIFNQTDTQDELEEYSHGKRDTSSNPSPETKLAIELLSKAIENILTNITRMQISQGINSQVVSDTLNAIQMGQSTSQAAVQQSQTIGSNVASSDAQHLSYSSSQVEENGLANVQHGQVQIDKDQASQNEVNQVNQNTQRSLQESDFQQSITNEQLNLSEAVTSSEHQSIGLSTQNVQNNVLNAQASVVAENQDHQVIPDVLANQIRSRFGGYNEMPLNNAQNLDQLGESIWTGPQIAQHNVQGSQQSFEGTELTWNGPPANWRYQNADTSNQNSQNNVLDVQQNFVVGNSVQSVEQNQAQNSNALQGSASLSTGSVTSQNQNQLNFHTFPEITTFQTHQNGDAYNQMPSNNAQNLHQLGESIWTGPQIAQHNVQGSQQSFEGTGLTWNEPPANWRYQNAGTSNQDSQNNVLDVQQNFVAQNSVQSVEQNQAENGNTLLLNQLINVRRQPIQNHLNGDEVHEKQNTLESSTAQNYWSGEQTVQHQNAGIANQNNQNNVLDGGVQSAIQNQAQTSNVLLLNQPVKGLASQSTGSVTGQNWQYQNANQNSHSVQSATQSQVQNSNALQGSASLSTGSVTSQNWQYQNANQNSHSVQTATQSQVQNSNALQGSASLSTGSVTNQNQLNFHTFPEVTTFQTYQNGGANNQVAANNVHSFGHVQDNLSGVQVHQNQNSLESSSAQNNWNDFEAVQEGQASQGHAGSVWNGGVTNWQHENTGTSTQNSQGSGFTNAQQGQINTYQGSAFGNQASWTGHSTNWQSQANAAGVRHKVQSNLYYSGDKVANQRAKYHFATRINDNINGNYQERDEHRSDGQVTGFYSYDDGNIFRTVSYVADEKGYRILSDDIQPSKKTSTLDGMAQVQWYNNGLSGEYSVTSGEVEGYKKAAAARGDIQGI